ncbi:TPA: aspartate aminotransferase family protein [Candidatus Bipolaricaulota bacterium]|nr:aspartate aminotransferase family protein [Candidatus Bipolaricaulota bacterium]
MDLKELIGKREGENFELHREYLNPFLVRVLEIIGYDVVYTRGKGAWLYDADGNRYLDFLSGYSVFNLGRNHPKVKAALMQVLELDRPNLVQMDCPLLAGILAQRLVEVVRRSFPGLDTVFFTNSGAEAVEGALKFARAATGRPRFLHLEHSFHGLTLGALSVNGDAYFRGGFGELLPATAIPMNDLAALERELKRGDVACFIAEPIQGKGVYVPDDDFLPAAQRLCRKYKALFVLDEVQTGFGRTGKFFCGEHWGLDPDIVTVAKTLSGGYVPVGAIIARRGVHRKVFRNLERAVVHSNTFGMNELAMAAGIATLEALEEEGLVARAAELGARFQAGLVALQQKYELVVDVRGKGLMLGIEFAPPRSLKLKAAWKGVEGVKRGLFAQLIVMALMREYRLLTQVSAHGVNIIKFLPPLIVGEEEIDYALEALDGVLAEAHRFPGGIWGLGKELVKAALSR